jgi:hypothetical protein
MTQFKVYDSKTGKVLEIATPNFMKDRIIKNSVPAPKGYAIDAGHAAQYKELLDRHGIPYEELTGAKSIRVEQCSLVRMEDERDRIYNRYAGRQIVERNTAAEKEFPSGTVVVKLDRKTGRRAILLLEPSMLYGLYQYDEFKPVIGEDKIIPVWRIVE